MTWKGGNTMEQPFVTLLKKVDKIDLSAGRYMRTKARKLCCFDESGDLNGCFIFSDTPQGFDYWCGINAKIKRG